MNKTDFIKIRITPEKKALWKEYVDAYRTIGSVSRLIELAVDDCISGKVESRDKKLGAGMHWVCPPTGKEKQAYDEEVARLAKERIKKHRKYVEEVHRMCAE